jgi:hypothetical protein
MRRPRRILRDLPKLDTIGPNTPLRLDVAATLAYPDGSMTASGLRRERDKGRLVIERTAGKDYTTLAYINRMRELCQVKEKVPASISVGRDATGADKSRIPPSTSSATEVISEAQAALRMILGEPNDALRSTSPASTNERPVKAVSAIRSKSQSPMC